MKIKTIDVNAKEWFDRINGNSYFSGTVIIDFGTNTQINYIMNPQYGYGDHYIDMAFQLLIQREVIEYNDNTCNTRMGRYCEQNNIILRTNIQRGCLKREVWNV